MSIDSLHEQGLVTADVDRVLRLTDLERAGLLDDAERAFLAELEQHRIGSALGNEVLAAPGAPPEAHSQRLTMSDAQRARADAILSAYGK